MILIRRRRTKQSIPFSLRVGGSDCFTSLLQINSCAADSHEHHDSDSDDKDCSDNQGHNVHVLIVAIWVDKDIHSASGSCCLHGCLPVGLQMEWNLCARPEVGCAVSDSHSTVVGAGR